MSETDITPHCDGCEDHPSSLFCEPCNAFYCASCDTTAHSVKNTRGHVRITANLQNSAGKVKFCGAHTGKKVELFCNDCSTLICLLCRDYGIHKNHSIDLIENTSQRLKHTLNEQVDNVRAITENAQQTLTKVEKAIKDIGFGENSTASSYYAAKAEVNSHFDRLLEVLNDRRAQLLGDVDYLAEQKKEQLNGQIQSLRQFIQTGASVVQQANAVGKLDDFSTCDAFLDTKSELDSVIKQSPSTSVPVSDSDIPTVFDDSLINIIRKFGVVGGPSRIRFDSATNGLCKVEWDEPITSENRTWTQYEIKAVIIARAPEFISSGRSNWFNVAGVYEKTIGRVSSDKFEILMVVNDLPGSTLEFSARAVDIEGRYSAWSTSSQKLRLPEEFALKTYELTGRPFSNNGLFYSLATNNGRHAYVNPHVSGAVTVTWSSIGGGNVEQIVNQEVGADFCFTNDEPQSWISVDIGSSRLLRPSVYALRHDIQSGRSVLRTWLFQAKKVEYDDWTTLSVHRDDAALAASAGSIAAFPVSQDGLEGYRFFRILQNGRNSSGKHRLLLSGLELYGTLY